MDPLVIDIPYLFRWFLINCLIVPKRKHTSAEAYQKIWTEKGSPLLIHSRALVQKVQLMLNVPCALGMRYGSPSILSALETLKQAGVENLVVVPLYPQFALSSTESSEVETRQALRKLNWPVKMTVVKDFFDRDEFIGPLVSKIQETVELEKLDKFVFSFHGLPVRHLQKITHPEANCYTRKSCCDRVSEFNRWCYRAQCFSTARKISARLGLSEDQYIVTFQSRLGRTEWIRNYTDEELPKLASNDKKRIAVVCPSFVSDCLETLEEINMRAREDFLKAGGTEFHYIPCLNDDEDWAEGLAKIVGGVLAPQSPQGEKQATLVCRIR